MKRNSSINTVCSTDESGAVEVTISPQQQQQQQQNGGNHQKKKIISKPIINQLIKRMKPPRHSLQHRRSSIENNHHDSNFGDVVVDDDNDDSVINNNVNQQRILVKSQSVIVTTTPKILQKEKQIRQVRSSHDFRMYNNSNDENKDNNTNNNSHSLTTSSVNHHRRHSYSSSNNENNDEIFLIASSVSDDFPKDNTETSTFQSIYNMMTSSLGMTNDNNDTHSEQNSESTSNVVGGSDDDTLKLTRKNSTLTTDTSVPSSSFFFKEDFDSTTWLEVNEINATNGISILGAAVMTATVVIHPLVFVAGAATAVWAVGFLHGLEKGYQFFSDGSFSDLFWADSDTSPTIDNNKQIATTETTIQNSSIDLEINKNYSLNNTPTNIIVLSPSNNKHLSSMDPIIKHHFPPLEQQIVSNVTFPGLNALEFFEVYFADDAPYSFKEFQATAGDIDIIYDNWKRKSFDDKATERFSFHPLAANSKDVYMRFPTSSRKERILNFKTLTKSYFGPAYATAKKTQRVSKFSTRLVVIESKTELFDIPFCDRFFVVERWIIEAEKDKSLPVTNNDDNNQQTEDTYTTKLSVSIEIFMLRSCKFENQIQQKTKSTVKDLVASWTKKARKALDLALEKKLLRQNLGRLEDGISMKSYKSSSVITRPQQEHALKMHKEKLKDIEEKITSGDIEVKEFEDEEDDTAFDEIANPDNWSNRPMEISFPAETLKLRKKGVLHLFNKKKK